MTATKTAAPGVVGLRLADDRDMTCVRCKRDVRVGRIICPECADELGKALKGADE